VMTPEIRSMITESTTVEGIRLQAMKQGTEALRISGARKVIKGITSMSEVLRVVPSVDTL
jgi:general secretion pathway protein E